MKGNSGGFYKLLIKRFFDFTIAFFALLVLSPIILFLTFMLLVSNSGRPFFTQTRPGKKARLFKVIKFKTMNDKHDKAGNLLPDAQRLTPVGKFIRKTSLDEIPQLINVLKGDMSHSGSSIQLVTNF